MPLNYTKDNKKIKGMVAPISEIGKIPPQAVDLEEFLLGAIIIDPECIETIYNDITPIVFYKDANQTIYTTLKTLYDSDAPIDFMTVVDQLRSEGNLDSIGGPMYIMQLTQKVASSAHVKFWALIIKDKYFKRELIRISQLVYNSAYEDGTDPAECIEIYQSNFEKTVQEYYGAQARKTFKQLLDQSRSEYLIREALAKENKLMGIPMPLYDLTLMTNGWQKADLTIIAGRPGSGKCHALGTKIIMFDGTMKKVEDIVAGDLLMGPDSKPRRVLSTTTGFEEMYTVHQKSGISYGVNGSHILCLKRSRNENNHKNGDIINISVNEWIASSKKFKSNYKGWKTEVEFSEKELPLDPYILGLWLGDGSAAKGDINKPDKEIIDHLKNYAIDLGYVYKCYHPEDKCPSSRVVIEREDKIRDINPMARVLKEMGLINNKHIPDIYLYNSKENRLKLLAGLLDSDGYMHMNYFEITQKSKELITQIKYLADSLGFSTHLVPKVGQIKKLNFKGLYYRLNISGNTDIIPNKVERKKAKPRKQIKNWRYSGIEVKPEGYGQYYGFELDGDGLYCLEDFTVTHNTALLLSFLKTAAMAGFKAGVFSLEMPGVRLVDRMLCGAANINAQKYKKGLLNEHEKASLNRVINEMYELGIDIDDNPNVTIDYVRNRCRILKNKGDIDILFIDYLQLLSVSKEKGKNREQEVSDISRKSKLLAKELDIPVIILAQLNRQCELRGGSKRPMMSDLRESGSLEQDADNIFLLYRPAYYKFDEFEDGTPAKGVGEIDVAKQRSGSVGPVKFAHDEALTRIYDYIDPRNTPTEIGTTSIDSDFLMPNTNFDSEKMF